MLYIQRESWAKMVSFSLPWLIGDDSGRASEISSQNQGPRLGFLRAFQNIQPNLIIASVLLFIIPSSGQSGIVPRVWFVLYLTIECAGYFACRKYNKRM